MRNLSEPELLTLAIDHGNKEALGELIIRCERSAYFTARRIMKSREDAEEAVQNASLLALRNIGQFSREVKFSTWYSHIVFNSCLTLKRRHKTYTFLTFDERRHPQFGHNTEKDLLRSEAAENVRSVVYSLPPKYKTPVEMRYLRDMKAIEISDALGLPNQTIKTWLFRARGILQRRLTVENLKDIVR